MKSPETVSYECGQIGNFFTEIWIQIRKIAFTINMHLIRVIRQEQKMKEVKFRNGKIKLPMSAAEMILSNGKPKYSKNYYNS